MTPEELAVGLKRLKASYPNMAPIEDSTTAAYAQELGKVKYEDFFEACRQVVRTSKFFPSIAELIEASDNACRKRLEAKEHDEREERLAIQGAIMDPKAEIHRFVCGPHHQRFLDLLSGKEKFPEPEWMTRKAAKARRPEAA